LGLAVNENKALFHSEKNPNLTAQPFFSIMILAGSSTAIISNVTVIFFQKVV